MLVPWRVRLHSLAFCFSSECCCFVSDVISMCDACWVQSGQD